MFKGPKNKQINRLGHKFVSDENGILDINIDALTKRKESIDENGEKYIEREALTTEEKEELIKTIKAYGFSEIVEEKKSK